MEVACRCKAHGMRAEHQAGAGVSRRWSEVKDHSPTPRCHNGGSCSVQVAPYLWRVSLEGTLVVQPPGEASCWSSRASAMAKRSEESTAACMSGVARSRLWKLGKLSCRPCTSCMNTYESAHSVICASTAHPHVPQVQASRSWGSYPAGPAPPACAQVVQHQACRD